MSETLYLPVLEKSVNWLNNNYTIVVGECGSGKTHFLNAVMDWCYKDGIKVVHYDSHSILSYATDLINGCSDKILSYACAVLSSFSIDFKSDIGRWAVNKGYELDTFREYIQDCVLLREMVHCCGTGYTRMICMLILGMENPNADYYILDIPETSLHIHIQRLLLKFLMGVFYNKKFVVATHSPEILSGIASTYNINEDENIVSLPEMFL